MSEGRIGRYEIKEEISRSGQTSVLRGYDPRFKRDVAIKVLSRNGSAQAALRARFEAASEIGAALEHAAIVPVYDAGEDDGQLFIVMRLMTGGSLARRIARGPLTASDAARIMARLAAALDDTHARGVVHGNLKPSNILFDTRGDAYISDFGMPATPDDPVRGDATTAPAIMSPEQLDGEPITRSADVYALGALLFEMLTGAAFPRNGIAASPASVTARLSAGLKRIIARATDGMPGRRFASAGDLDAAVSIELIQSSQKDAQARQPAPEVDAAPSPAEQLAQLRSEIARLSVETAAADVVVSNRNAAVSPPPATVQAPPVAPPAPKAAAAPVQPAPQPPSRPSDSAAFAAGGQAQSQSGPPDQQKKPPEPPVDPVEQERQRKLASLLLQLSDSEAHSRWLDVLQIGEELLKIDAQLPEARAAASRAYKFRGSMYHYQRDFALAIADFTRGIDLLPSDSELYYKRALSLQGRQRAEDALEDFGRAIELAPTHALYYAGRGSLYLAIDDFTHALDDITRAIDFQPWDARYYAQRGVALMRQFATRRIAFAQQSLDRAISDLTHAIQLDARNSAYYAYRCAAYQLKGLTERAQLDIARAIELDPDDGTYHFTQGMLLRAHGNHAAAERSLKHAANLGDTNARRELGMPEHRTPEPASRPKDKAKASKSGKARDVRDAAPERSFISMSTVFHVVIGALGLILGISIAYFCLSPLVSTRGAAGIDSLRLAGLLFGCILAVQSGWTLWSGLDAQQSKAA